MADTNADHRPPEWVLKRLLQAPRLRLFLDYDGTLDELAPSPDDVLPNPEVIALVSRLVANRRCRVAVVSGRRLDQVTQLLPVPGLLIAGTYGIEVRTPEGKTVSRLDFESVRPAIEELKARWQKLLAGREAFFLEDKGWSLAIHGRYASDSAAEEVIAAARRTAEELLSPQVFRLLGGHKFFEAAPRVANKGDAVDYLIHTYSWPDALALYLGDDDKDQEAFPVIHRHGGLAGLVGPRAESEADFYLSSPRDVRQLLARLAD